MPELELPAPPLADDAVLLRPWTPADLPAIVTGFGDPVTQRFSWPYERVYAEADAHEFLSVQERARRRGEEMHCALAEPDDPARVLGGASLYGIDLEQGRAAVGYWLMPARRGRGLASRAVRLLAGWAFEELRIARLELTCGPDNVASQRVAERCGFVREGLLRSHMAYKGGRRDTVMFSLLPGELRYSSGT